MARDLDIVSYAIVMSGGVKVQKLSHYVIEKGKPPVTTKLLKLDDDLQVTIGHYDSPTSYLVVPRGFVFDGASIPKLLRPFFGKGTEHYYHAAAATHDYLYAFGSYILKEGESELLSSHHRKFADEVFFRLLQVYAQEELGAFKTALMYASLRIFGSGSYISHASAEINYNRFTAGLLPVPFKNEKE